MRARRRSGGQSIEFALLFPVYFLMVTAIADFGWMAFHAASLYGAAHVGCRAGSLVDPGFGESKMDSVIGTASDRMELYFVERGPGCGEKGCPTSAEPIGDRPGRSLRCQIGVHYEPLVGYVVRETDLWATAVVRLEFQRGG